MQDRASGLLLHPTALPSRWGIGDLGDEAYKFVDFLVRSGQRYWQILPLGPTGHGNSPYQSLSSFAGNPLLISLDRLVHQGLLPHEVLVNPPCPAPAANGNKVDYQTVRHFKECCLQLSFEHFKRNASNERRESFRQFSYEKQDWLDDYALFVALKEDYQGRAWSEWDEGLILREPDAMDEARARLVDSIARHRYYQYLFFVQWDELRRYANKHAVEIIGDMPIFVAYDGADVWSHPELFFLDEKRRPTFVAGVPPDYFSPTGQLWGNPLYDWDKMAEDGYAWWIERVQGTLAQVDIVRLDHFRAFEAYWEIPADELTAVNGRWVKGPGGKLFRALEQAVGSLPFIAEDLGLITPEVEELRDEFNQPGMKVLQFAFGDTARNPYLPHNHRTNCVVYTGTHDNDTTVGWYQNLEETDRLVIQSYLGHKVPDVSWDLLRVAWKSVANTAIAPVQDLLRLGSESRMNVPGIGEGNWEWRLTPGSLTENVAASLKQLTVFYGRTPEKHKLRDNLSGWGLAS